MGKLNEDDGPWFIRSHYHNAWHCRGSEGGANGYTDDLAKAGLFNYDVALKYNDWGEPGGRDEAVPAKSQIAALEKGAEKTAEELAELEDRIRLIKAKIGEAQS